MTEVKQKTKQTAFRLPDEVLERLDEHGERLGIYDNRNRALIALIMRAEVTPARIKVKPQPQQN